MSDFEKFAEELPKKEKFYSSVTGKNFVIKSMSIFFGIYLNDENDEKLSQLVLKL